MRRKWLWLLVGCLVGLALVLASCGEAIEEEEQEEEEEEIVEEEEEVAEEEEEKKVSSDEPRYGGVFTTITDQEVRNFDDIFPWACGCHSLILTNEELMHGNWARGPAGTGEVTWGLQNGFEAMERFEDTGLAESWNIDADTATVTFHLREGIHFHNKPPANGRELTADDVVYCIKRNYDAPTSFIHNAKPNPISVTATDKYTVEVKYSSIGNATQGFIMLGDGIMIYPPEAIEEYGNMTDWKNSVGTGPFMLTDYVKSSSLTLIRNPNYWETDPIGPGKGNQLPYVDGVKILIIVDPSTQVAALRTAKADQARIRWEDAATLRNTNPELLYSTNYASAKSIAFRMDNPEAPWYNLEVRQALNMAIDYQEIVDTYFGGEADFYSYPTMPGIEYNDMRLPFDELPANVQELFEYNPDRSRELLEAAGYSEGFDIEVICLVTDADLMSVYKDFWENINVNMIIVPKEYSVFTSIMNGRTEKDAIFATTYTSLPFNMNCVRNPQTSPWNVGFIFDQACIDAHKAVWDNYLDWEKRCQAFKDVTPHILENCWFIQSPSYNQYTMWHPWVKNYHGENALGNCDFPDFSAYIWIDQDLKEEMTGRR